MHSFTLHHNDLWCSNLIRVTHVKMLCTCHDSHFWTLGSLLMCHSFFHLFSHFPSFSAMFWCVSSFYTLYRPLGKEVHGRDFLSEAVVSGTETDTHARHRYTFMKHLQTNCTLASWHWQRAQPRKKHDRNHMIILQCSHTCCTHKTSKSLSSAHSYALF